jgi:hypothetical protein
MLASCAALFAVCAPTTATADGSDPGLGAAGKAEAAIVALDYDKAREILAKADPNTHALALA